MNDSYSDSSSPRSFDPRTPRSEPRSPWTFTGSTRIDLRDVIKDTPRDRIHRRGDSNVHAQYRDVTAEIVQRHKALRINDDNAAVNVKQSHLFQTPRSPSSDAYTYKLNGLSPRSPVDEELGSLRYREVPIAHTPYPDYGTSRKEPISVRSDAYNSSMYRNGIENTQTAGPRNGDFTVRSVHYTSPQRNDLGAVDTERSILQRSLSPPPDYMGTQDDMPKYDTQNPPPQQRRQSRHETRRNHGPSVRSRQFKGTRSKSAPPGTITRDGRMLFDPTKNKQLWTKWRIEATERIIQETKNRHKKGMHQRERFGSALVHPPPGLARLIDVTQSTRQRACTLMDSGDRGTTSELLTKQFIYFGVPRVTLKTFSVPTTNS